MKKTLLAALALATPAVLMAQSAVDAYTLSQTEVRGTARFMSMGGAFTALGGDLSTLTQNPAGIGVYRRSEIGATLDISPRKISANTGDYNLSTSKTKVNCNNFGYIGTVRLDGALRTFSWGATYNRVASFDRTFKAYNGAGAASVTDYIASFTNSAAGGAPSESSLGFGDNYNPYFDSDNDWLSILAYNSFFINPAANGYRGLSDRNTNGDAESVVHERGYVDEYNIDFGGNVSDVFMWGIGFGITDLSYNSTTYYSESMENAWVPSDGNLVRGNAGINLDNWRAITGTGFNLKVGVIVKPVDMLRIGAAIHTPTWYSMSSSGYAETQYSYLNPTAPQTDTNPLTGSEYTEDAYYNFHMNAPWKFMVGAAAVIGNSAIVSLDYERQAYNDIKVSYQDQWGSYVSDDYVNDDVKNYFKASDIIRIGAEYRVTPRFSVRAGYNYATTSTKSEAADGDIEIYTAGMNPAYTLNRENYAISLGLGYRYKAFYIDGAYIYRNKKSTYKAFTNYGNVTSPTADLTETTNSIVLSAGFKF